MTAKNHFDVIIIGGSYAGLSAAMALGRALRTVLIIDGGLPCNRPTPHSHNFITQDGEKPHIITDKARSQVLQYPTVSFLTDQAVSGAQTDQGFTIITKTGATFHSEKLIFATGLQDHLPDIKGFSECWGISAIHCPYCHGYEVKQAKTGILANGDVAFHYAQLISNWTNKLAIFTNGISTLTPEQTRKVGKRNIRVVEKEIMHLDHQNGQVSRIVFKDLSTYDLKVIYHRANYEQHCKIPQELGCELTEQGVLKVDMFQKTTVDNVFACGDNANPLRSVACAVAAGNVAGAALNNSLTEAEF